MVRRCWKFILVCWVSFLEVGRWHSLLLQDQERCEESSERWKPIGFKCCAGACESGGLADHNQTVGANESVTRCCAGCRGGCANAHRGSENRALHERSPMCPDVKTARCHREGCEAGRCQKRRFGQSHCSFGRCGRPLQRPVGQTKALAAREEEQDFYEENEYDMETDHVGRWWRADKLGNSWQESWNQSYWKEDDRASPDLMHPSLEIDMLKSVIAEAQQTQHAFQQSIMAENAKFQQNVASMLGKLWEDAQRAPSTPLGTVVPFTPNQDWSERKRQAISGVNTDCPLPEYRKTKTR